MSHCNMILHLFWHHSENYWMLAFPISLDWKNGLETQKNKNNLERKQLMFTVSGRSFIHTTSGQLWAPNANNCSWEKMPAFLQSNGETDFFFLALHLHCQAEGETWAVSEVTTELWRAVVKAVGSQLVFSSVLLVRAKPWREEWLKNPG